MLSDEALMRQYQMTLDANAFERLVERYWARGFAVALRLLDDRHAAEDALQEAFLRLLRGAEKYDCSQPFACWFYTILRNTCVDLRRRQRPAPGDAIANPAQATVQGDEREEVSVWLAQLSPMDRDILLLRIVQAMSFAEIALALGCSEDAARKRVQRALRRLRTCCVGSELLKI